MWGKLVDREYDTTHCVVRGIVYIRIKTVLCVSDLRLFFFVLDATHEGYPTGGVLSAHGMVVNPWCNPPTTQSRCIIFCAGRRIFASRVGYLLPWSVFSIFVLNSYFATTYGLPNKPSYHV